GTSRMAGVSISMMERRPPGNSACMPMKRAPLFSLVASLLLIGCADPDPEHPSVTPPDGGSAGSTPPAAGSGGSNSSNGGGAGGAGMFGAGGSRDGAGGN